MAVYLFGHHSRNTCTQNYHKQMRGFEEFKTTTMTQLVKKLRKSLQPDLRSIYAVIRSTGEMDFTD